MKIAASVFVMFLFTGCAGQTIHQEGYYINDEYTKWHRGRIEQCRMEAAVITIAKFEANRELTGWELQELNKWLEVKCMSYYGLVI